MALRDPAVPRWVTLLLALASGAASAQPMSANDFRLGQLGNPDPALPDGVASDSAFRAFARQFGAAMSSVNLAPPGTLGASGFAVNAELSVVDLRGSTLPTAGAAGGTPFSGPLLIPSLHLRKGLPWSLEVGARGAWIEGSRMGVATVELKWALNEGFTYLPDIAVRGHLSKLINGRELDLTVGGVDLGIGKQFALAGTVTLTPYVGWNLLFVGASTGNVNFGGGRTLAQADAAPAAGAFVFTPLKGLDNTGNRFYLGFRFLVGILQVGAEFSYVVGTSFKPPSQASTSYGVNSVVVWNSTMGLEF